MSNQPGDRFLGHGDQDTRLNNTGSSLGAGLWVTPTGDETVALADATPLVGCMAYNVAAGDKGTVNYRGVVYARVESTVAAGDELAAPDSGATSGATTPGVAGSGGASGIFALEGAKDPEGDGNYYAKCLIR